MDARRTVAFRPAKEVIAISYQSNATILLVDDDETPLFLLERNLRDLPCRKIKALNGEEALQKADESPIDLVVLDVSMPGMDGFETCRRLKEKFEFLPILMLTGLNDRESLLKGIESGADDFLGKPVDAIELKLRIKNFLHTKHLYDNVKKWNEELERKVDERTRELKAANEELELLDRLKSDFLMFISHELQSPLTSMQGAIELLDRNENPANHDKLIRIMHNSYTRLADFVKRGIEYIQEQSTATCDLASVSDVNAVLLDVISETRRLLDDDVDIRVEPAPAPLYVRGDAVSLSKAIRILVDNAVKYSHNNISVQATIRADETNVTITVADNGEGFPPELAGEIFRPFTIADIDHFSRGTGLSLPIAKILVENCRGRVWAESNGIGKGAAFYVELPLYHQDSR